MPFSQRGGASIAYQRKWSRRRPGNEEVPNVMDHDDSSAEAAALLRNYLETTALSRHRISLCRSGLDCLTLWTSDLLSDTIPSEPQPEADVTWDEEITVEPGNHSDGE